MPADIADPRSRGIGSNRLYASIAAVLLCLQIALPWTARHFVTEDGPSHLYGALVTWDLLTNAHSHYGLVYHLQAVPVPNWSATVMMRMLAGIAGPAHAEQLLISLLFVFHFFAYSFACRSFASGRLAWSPVANVLIQTYFLTRGYYNFLLGMDAFLLLLGYGVRHIQRPDRLTTLILSLGSVVLYLTHIVPTFVAILTLVSVACWVHLVAPLLSRPDNGNPFRKAGLKSVAQLSAALSPAILLGLYYAVRSTRGSAPRVFEFGWRQFPSYLFRMSSGPGTYDAYVFIGLAMVFVAVACSMTKSEWRSPCGGLVLATVLITVFSLLGPDTGFGGGEVRLRLLWAAILTAGVLMAVVSTPIVISTALNLSATFVVAFGLLSTVQVNARLSAVTDRYIAVLNAIPSDSIAARLNYPAPHLMSTAGVPADLLFAPLLHVDSYVAALHGWIALTDYQASTRTFPVVFQPGFSSAEAGLLELLEAAPLVASPDLRRLIRDLPNQPDDYVVFGEERGNLPAEEALREAIAILNDSGRKLLSSDGDPPYVRIFN